MKKMRCGKPGGWFICGYKKWQNCGVQLRFGSAAPPNINMTGSLKLAESFVGVGTVKAKDTR